MRQHGYGPRPAQLKWLLNSDPAIRWQVMRDLTDEAPNAIAAVVLMDVGLNPASKQARRMIDRVDKQLVLKPLNNRSFLHGETEPCINGRILAIDAYFNKPNHGLANQLLREQLEDGGWNCEAVEPSPKRPKSRRSSFHTTICVLEGLLAYERAGRKSAAVTKARKRGENYLLERRMFRSLRTVAISASYHRSWLFSAWSTFEIKT